jgi:hypothetical protein
MPASRAAESSTLRRTGPHCAGWVSPYLIRLFAAELANGLAEHAPQNGGEHLVHRHDVGAEQQGLLVDTALGVGLESRRVEPGTTFGVATDHQHAVFAGEHR